MNFKSLIRFPALLGGEGGGKWDYFIDEKVCNIYKNILNIAFAIKTEENMAAEMF